MMHGQFFDPKRYIAVFENPHYPYREGVPKLAWLWTLLFGIFYLAFRRQWTHVAIIAGLIILFTFTLPLLLFLAAPFAWIIYATQASSIMINSYYRAGWRPVDMYEQEGVVL